MRRVLVWVWRNLQRIKLHKKIISIREGSLFNESTIFEGYNKINRNCHLYGAYVGNGTYIGDECMLNNTYIGKYCALGAGIRVSLGDHPIHKVVSIHPAFFSIEKQAGFTYCTQDVWKSAKQKEGKYACSIGNDVWIGDGVTLLGVLQLQMEL